MNISTRDSQNTFMYYREEFDYLSQEEAIAFVTEELNYCASIEGYMVAVTTRVDVIFALPATFESGDWQYSVRQGDEYTYAVITKSYILA